MARIALWKVPLQARGKTRGIFFGEGLVSYVHGENGGTTADIENDLVLENVLVLHDSVHV